MSQPSENSLIAGQPAPSVWSSLLDAINNREYETALDLLGGIPASLEPPIEHVHSGLYKAALLSGNIHIYKRVCEVINNSYLLNPLYFEALVRSNEYRAIQLLAKLYPDAVYKLANSDSPPIHIAAQASSAEAFEILLPFTTKETALRPSSNNISLLTEATLKGPDCIVEMLTEQPFISDLIRSARTEDHPCTPLHNAAHNCSYPTLIKLCDAYTALGSICDLPAQHGHTILTVAIYSGDKPKAQQLIEHLGPNHILLTKPDSNGHTPLHWAAIHGLDDVITTLYPIYSAQGLVLARTVENGHTFFNYLVHFDRVSIIRQLLERDDFDPKLVSEPDNSNQMPIVYALDEEHVETCELLYPINVKTGSIARTHKKGQNILMTAIGLELLWAVQLLTSEPAVCGELMVGDKNGRTPLHWAIGADTPEICELVYERSTVEQVCVRDKHRGWTILHMAIMYRSLDTVKILLRDHGKARAMMAVKDADGLTAMDYARMRSSKIVAMLEAVTDA